MGFQWLWLSSKARVWQRKFVFYSHLLQKVATPNPQQCFYFKVWEWRQQKKWPGKKKLPWEKKINLPQQFWREKIDAVNGSWFGKAPFPKKACGYGGGIQIPWNFMVHLKTTELLDILFGVPNLGQLEDNQACPEVLGEAWDDYFQISCFTKCCRRTI